MDVRPKIEGTNIIFDYFGLREDGYKYFLSHAHTDHIRGLSDDWHWGDIYCSHETRAIVLKKWPSLAPYLKGRELEESFDVTLDAEDRVSVQVRMIDAHHCLGSVIFVVDGFFGRAVYTGDFRVERETLEHEIWKEGLPVEYLFLDNTLHASTMQHVDRAHWRELICELAKFYPPHTRFEVGVETLGKEEVLEAMAKTLNTKVLVSRERFEIIRDVSDLDSSHFVWRDEDQSMARIKVVSRTMINERRIMELNESASDFVVCILLQECGSNQRRQVLFNGAYPPETLHVDDLVKLRRLSAASHSLNDIHRRRFFLVPYTLHATRYELASFVQLLQPHHMFGIVSRERKGDLLEYLTRWRGSPSDTYLAQLRKQWDEYKEIVQSQAGSPNGFKEKLTTKQQQREELVRMITKARVSRKNFDSVIALRKPGKTSSKSNVTPDSQEALQLFASQSPSSQSKWKKSTKSEDIISSKTKRTGMRGETSLPDSSANQKEKIENLRTVAQGDINHDETGDKHNDANDVSSGMQGDRNSKPSIQQSSLEKITDPATKRPSQKTMWTKQMDTIVLSIGKLRSTNPDWGETQDRAERLLLSLVNKPQHECMERYAELKLLQEQKETSPSRLNVQSDDEQEDNNADFTGPGQKRYKKRRKKVSKRLLTSSLTTNV